MYYYVAAIASDFCNYLFRDAKREKEKEREKKREDTHVLMIVRSNNSTNCQEEKRVFIARRLRLTLCNSASNRGKFTLAI